MQPQALLYFLLQLIDQIRLGALQLRLVFEPPVAAHNRIPLGLEHQQVRRWQLAYAAEHGQRRSDEAQRKVLIECRKIERTQRSVEGEQRLDLGREGKAARRACVIEWLLPQVVTR